MLIHRPPHHFFNHLNRNFDCCLNKETQKYSKCFICIQSKRIFLQKRYGAVFLVFFKELYIDKFCYKMYFNHNSLLIINFNWFKKVLLIILMLLSQLFIMLLMTQKKFKNTLRAVQISSLTHTMKQCKYQKCWNYRRNNIKHFNNY